MVTIFITLYVLIFNTLLWTVSGAKENRILHVAANSKSTWSKPNLMRTQRFQMGHANVSFCHPIANSEGSPIPMSNSTQDIQSITPVNLSPTECANPKCTIPNFGTPVLSSCEVVAQALMNNSTGTFVVPPNTWVVVSHGNCALAFQNNVENKYTLQYQWAQFGLEAVKLIDRCLLPQDGPTGGQCLYDSYLDYKFEKVGIMLSSWKDEINFIDSD
ncbi:hypothetical protein PGT21_016702 [Puccinia graminis f. sp. tritici]|uniref:Ecp2 effector protein domain-containing protein n=2 Tax=Puccinia graminis f. sp. tritici TaxID=56615 RepID=A0A5B0SCL6_PUCGR|nr:hypothetical protein PGT21_016702 [Puccinia graminis f. sp. tritici]KAA1135796.1 hypothetical protein PGTUg99_025095 [Puccinia graminis f. sp. tritici]